MAEKIPLKVRLKICRDKIKECIKYLLLFRFHRGYKRWCHLCEVVDLGPRTWEEYLDDEHWIWSKVDEW